MAAIEKETTALEKFLKTLSPEQMAFSPAPDAWAVKDYMSHLHEWIQMVFTWYEASLRGETPAVPAQGYKWSQLPALNQQIYEKYQHLTPEQALSLWRGSHQKMLEFIQALPEAELTTPGRYRWMNQNTLMAYIYSGTAAHYVWALKDIKKLVRG